MDGGGKLVELLLVLALVLGFGLRELWLLRRARRRDQRHGERRETPP